MVIVFLTIGLILFVPFIIGIHDGIRGRATIAQPLPLENDDTSDDIVKQETIENYGRQIEGYNSLIELLNTAYKTETDEKKKAAILSKELTAMEKLNKTIEKLDRLENKT